MAQVYPEGADQRIADPDWMLREDQEGWVALTKDYSVVRDHRDVLAETTLRAFAYNDANLTGPELVDRLGRHTQHRRQSLRAIYSYPCCQTRNPLDAQFLL